ncbi:MULTISPECIES: ABC transporter ATP-binding protein [unclassified Haladaptatus]|uniref:ABC transporter ATP-binding protein n=1 Tax=unclassified Haladaptatus TaxID=2622732 RepID=UPI00209C2809|nr:MULTISPECIES: ABC transporter ATP-binding protein [unclassified Haladaptatus]MCO8246145.1 ABC transporter ATP-binding protein [Haladaptatus sp. AB643]MCO8254235.1 ABC transporter ATP-binding protein [Haladaptatus sp. AB618]
MSIESPRTESKADEATGANGEAATGTTEGETESILRVENLQKRYGDGADAVTAVDGVSFDVERGSVVGLLGPNGAGKTTTIKSILGLIIPSGGRVIVDGIDVHADTKRAYRHVGAMLEGARNVYWRLTVRENLEFFAALAGQRPADTRERHDQLLDQFDLSDKADTAVRELSRGMKQKVSLACTLARDVDVVFLDEPTLGLDVESSLELRAELRNLADETGTTVLLSSHDMDVIEDICDRVIIMSDGHVVADDSPDNLLDLFHTQAYAVQVASEISAATRRHLEDAFDATEFERQADRERFVVSVTGDEFYELADCLRENGLTVASMASVEPDLEDVFLSITDDTGGEGA